MEERLKPCPFCGGEAEVNLLLGNYGVTCTECMGAVFPAKGMTKEEAIEEWNARKPMERIVEQLEKRKEYNETTHARFNRATLGLIYKNKAESYETAIEIVKKETNHGHQDD